MLFTIGYLDGDEIIGSETVDGADAVCEAEQQIEEVTGGNINVLLLEPSMRFIGERWRVRYKGVDKILHCDHRRTPPWSADKEHWEGCYHAIERLFS